MTDGVVYLMYALDKTLKILKWSDDHALHFFEHYLSDPSSALLNNVSGFSHPSYRHRIKFLYSSI